MPKEHKPFKIDILANHPLFLAGTKERAKEVGLTIALAEKMRASNINIIFEGDTSRFNKAGSPALLIGDHKTSLENILMLAAFGSFPREDIKSTGKTFALSGHLITALGQDENDYIIPIMPQTLAKDRPGGAVVSKILFSRDLLTKDEIRLQNTQSLQDAAKELNEGRVVLICPSGKLNDARTNKWFRGVGEIIKQVRPDRRDSIPIVPFFFEGIRPLNIVKALMLSSMGIKPKEQNIIIHLGKQDTIEAVFHGKSDTDSISSTDITEILRQRFITDFPIRSRRVR